MPPPSSGGTVLIEMLNILEGFPIGDAGFGSATGVHWTYRRWKPCDEGLPTGPGISGIRIFDPAMPVDQLISKTHAAALRDSIRAERASVSRVDRFDWPREGNETTICPWWTGTATPSH